jgi:hypothetical protein
VENRTRTRSGGLVVLVVVALGAATGCIWSIPSFDAAGTRFNTSEHQFVDENIGILERAWSADLGPATDATFIPVSVAGKVVTSAGGRIRVHATTAGAGCSLAPDRRCEPLWTSAGASDTLGQPVVIGDLVYAFAADGSLRAYALDGGAGCSGVPTTCAPAGVAIDAVTPAAWSAPVLTVAGTTAYLAGRDVRAYDIGALRTCVTTAAACTPTWSFTPDPALADTAVTHLAVSNGRVFGAVSRPAGVGTTRIASVAANGQTGCSGTPTVCSEQWTTDAVAGLAVDVASDGSRLILAFSPRPGSIPGPGQDGDLVVYDIVSCAQEVTGCPDYWRAATMVDPSRIAIGEEHIYVGNDAGADRVVEAYDRNGIGSCTGFMPELCSPDIRFEDPGSDVGGTPVVASSHLFVGGRAFDAAGADGCAGWSPERCESLRSDGASGEAIVLNGRVHWVDATDPTHLVLRTDQIPT